MHCLRLHCTTQQGCSRHQETTGTCNLHVCSTDFPINWNRAVWRHGESAPQVFVYICCITWNSDITYIRYAYTHSAVVWNVLLTSDPSTTAVIKRFNRRHAKSHAPSQYISMNSLIVVTNGKSKPTEWFPLFKASNGPPNTQSAIKPIGNCFTQSERELISSNVPLPRNTL